MLKHRKIHIALLSLILILATVFVPGCGRIKLTTGLGKDTFAKINGETVDMSTAKLLLSELKYSYEKTFDANVWGEPLENVTTEEYVKNSVRDTIEHVICLNRMAKDATVRLSDEDHKMIKEAAALYYSELPAKTIDKGDFDRDTVEEYYTLLRIAEKVFYSVTDDIDTEVSTDEARVINVQYIFFSAMEYDDAGNSVSVSESECKSKKKSAENVLEQIEEGSDFLSLARENSDDSQVVLEFGRGEYLKQFEDAAFALEMGTVSDVVETDIGYYIIKCTNDNVESDYEKRSKEVVFSRRMESFAEKYAEFSQECDGEFNSDFWEKTPMEQLEAGSGRLYEIYEMYFVSTQ